MYKIRVSPSNLTLDTPKVTPSNLTPNRRTGDTTGYPPSNHPRVFPNRCLIFIDYPRTLIPLCLSLFSFRCYLILVKIRLGVVGAPAQPLGCRYVVRAPTVAVTPSAEGCGAYLWGSYLTVAWGVSEGPQRTSVYPSLPRAAAAVSVRPLGVSILC
jgi:hypothetical protein